MNSREQKAPLAEAGKKPQSLGRRVWNYEPKSKRAHAVFSWCVAVISAAVPALVYWALWSRISEVLRETPTVPADEVWALILIIPACALAFAAITELLDFVRVGNGWWMPLAGKSMAVGATLAVVVVSAIAL